MEGRGMWGREMVLMKRSERRINTAVKMGTRGASLRAALAGINRLMHQLVLETIAAVDIRRFGLCIFSRHDEVPPIRPYRRCLQARPLRASYDGATVR